MGETLYRRPEILFRWGRLCFDTESPGGDFISVKGRLCFGGRLYFVSPAVEEMQQNLRLIARLIVARHECTYFTSNIISNFSYLLSYIITVFSGNAVCRPAFS